jgi:hypothetical protein
LRHLVLHVPSSPKCIRGLFTMYVTVSQNCTCARPSLRPSHALISPSPVFDRLSVPCCPSPFRPAPPPVLFPGRFPPYGNGASSCVPSSVDRP